MKHFNANSKRIATLLVVMSLLMLQSQQVWAAGALTTPRDYLNRQKASLTTGVQHEIFFTTLSAVSGGAGNNKVIIQFPDADDGLWCRTAGSLTVTGIANPTGSTESATILPGAFTSSTCSQGSGPSSYDKLNINTVNDLGATTKYGVRITGNAGALGTPTAANSIKIIVTTNNGTIDIDTATLATSIISDDQIVVTATVDPTLTVAVSGSGAASLGTLSTSQVNQAPITSTVSTNANGGFVSLIKYGATLTSGAFTIPDESGGGTIVAGTSEYGVTSDDNTSTDFSSAISNSCSSGAGPMNAKALTTTFQIFASESAAASGDVTTICFVATTSATQQPGTYTSTATLVTTARF